MLDKSPARGPGTRTPDQMHRQARMLRLWALAVLVPVAVIGAALSFQSLYLAAAPVFGRQFALGFPLLVDFLILGASLQYVAGAKIGRPRAGWRWTAHAGAAGTLILNAMAARTLHDVPWHVTAPAVWSVLVELTAREVLGQWRAIHAPLGDRIPLRLWLTAPLESTRTWLRMARRVDGEQARARLDVGIHEAAVEALKLALPQRRARTARRIIQRQLRAGSLPPAAVLGPLGWLDTQDALTEITPHTVLRATLRDTLRGPQPPAQAPDPDTETPTPVPPDPRPAPTASKPAEPAEPVGERSAEPPTSDAPVGTHVTGPIANESQPAPEQRPAIEPPQEPVIDLRQCSVPETETTTRTALAAAARIAKDIDSEPVDPMTSTGDRFADAVEIVRVRETITAAELATQLRSLGWQLSHRTAGRILNEVRHHLQQMDPWALPTP